MASSVSLLVLCCFNISSSVHVMVSCCSFVAHACLLSCLPFLFSLILRLVFMGAQCLVYTV
ncbi:hypothetical protein DFH09DRAFT_1198251 [Mycena vulgaris]|nr:hypothetical protein DFH09DRAFT_1198251 [Mycena vulgaris]